MSEVSDGRQAGRKRRIRLTVTAVLGSGIIFGPAAFIFQSTQSWVSGYTTVPKSLFEWLVPALCTASYMLLVGLVFSLLTRHRTEWLTEPSERFRAAVTDYALHLSNRRRDAALLELQDGVGWVFHAQSANRDRVALGTLALDAAIRQDNVERQVAILVDDLGWANHMAGSDSAAVESIDRAIEILAQLPEERWTPTLRRLRAKGYRHRAIISSRWNLESAKKDLLSAEEDIVAAISPGLARDIEVGQLKHAEALCISVSLSILDGARIRPGDSERLEQAEAALACARDAERRFSDPGEWQFTRFAKALYLEHALLVSLGRDLEAREVKTKLDDALARSAWDINAAQLNYRGV